MAEKIVQVTTSSANWRAVASDGTLHTDLSAIAAAGKVPYPGLDPGGMLQSLLARSITSAGADGSAFFIAINRASVPTDAEAHLVSGSGQTLTIPGFAPPISIQVIRCVWIRKTVAGDYVILNGTY